VIAGPPASVPAQPEPSEPLAGGNLGPVVKVGDTVRRVAGPWTPTVHAVMRHLRAAGFDLVPEPLGIDDLGREVLQYIPGETAGQFPAWPDWLWTDSLLEQVGGAVRRFHDAVAGFRPAGAIWRLSAGGFRPGDIVCHNDIAPYNVVCRDGQLAGIIDWDIVAPGPPIWDVAFCAWHWAPLYPPDSLGWPGAAPPESAVARRLKLLCDSYRLQHRSGLLDVVEARILASRDGILEGARRGEEAFVRLEAEGHAVEMERTLAYVAAVKDRLQDGLVSYRP